MSSTRTETDTMGSIQVPADRLWGAQTQRSLENFRIGSDRFSPSVIRAFGVVKKACAIANRKLGTLDAQKAQWISEAADEVIAGRWNDQFPLVVWQTGSGTQSNMNANEVIANRANLLAGGQLGAKTPVHPNDDVNRSQSSNDVFPTVMHIAVAHDFETRLLPALTKLRVALEAHRDNFAKIAKIGRTHLMDATPLSLGQEFGGYAAQLSFSERRLEECLAPLFELALGGTAVGTGLNTPHGWADTVAEEIGEITGRPFKTAPNKFMALAAHEAIVGASAALRTLATSCFKIASDLRLLGSGPRCGIGELLLPENEPGSSIMPGKVNPTQCEAMTMVALRILGNDAAIGFANSQGHLELNAFKPLLLHTLLESTTLLSDAMDSFRKNCVEGLLPNLGNIERHLQNSLMLVTALTPTLGYDKAAAIAKAALENNQPLREAALQLGFLSADEFDAAVRAEAMMAPHKGP